MWISKGRLKSMKELPTVSIDSKSSKKYFVDFKNIKSIQELEQVSQEAVWQNFERLVGFVFEMNDFHVDVNIVKTSKRRRRQYDVIARKDDRTYLVECKKWAGNRRRLSALKRAIEQHEERTEFYRVLTGEDAVPVVVTLIEEEIKFYEDMPVVPIFRLNSFINEAIFGAAVEDCIVNNSDSAP